MTRARVIVLAFDAMDAPTTTAMVRRGDLPAFSRLLQGAATARTVPPYGLYVSGLWPSLVTGWAPDRTGYICWEEIVPGTYERRMTTVDSIRGVPFWRALRNAGRRAAIVDVPHSVAEDLGDGVHISEWGCHDRHVGLRIEPAAARDEVLSRFGTHPVLGVDALDLPNYAPDDYVYRAGPLRVAAEERALLDGLLAGAAAKERLSTHLLAAGGWDLFMSVCGEAHGVGHQQWYLHDAGDPRHDAALTHQLGDPVEAVYRRMDGVLESHLALADADSVVIVLLSHGMGSHHDGTHLLSEVVRRLDTARHGRLERSAAGRAAARAWSLVPPAAMGAAGAAAAGALRRRLRARPPVPVREHDNDDDRRRAHAFMAPNNSVIAGIRLNLAGREPHGLVAPGREANEELAWLEAALGRLVNVRSGRPVFAAVERSDRRYRRHAGDAVPDLLMEWNREVPTETVWSPDIGVVYRPYDHWRSGDHRPHGLLIASAPGLRSTVMPDVDIVDIGPTLAAMTGVTLDDTDGRPVRWLASLAAVPGAAAR